ncbi:metalloregulator ArsR/SmtB family transcription factor [Saccharothrix algeriensis]|uniref:DNA-binding transcriptional ArsR family regulator n=1 Tax=Saccharothrix algeriensis TaxID=173560 RepID=A0ABS2SF98_9PSEU|nr:metalloregulator ArsR/SmtB family transcription factor [Saccharothrix algeriensis]MBM7813938.1 DNA-binding transcriptional ArsR family regulator [Saccharothrix algeriensis]
MDEVAAAIADPVRRRILELLRDSRLPAGEIAARFDISRPAVSRHLRVLRESGLVRDELVGRQRFYALDPAPLDGLASWLARLTRPADLTPADRSPADRSPAGWTPADWAHRLDALETEVHRTRRDRRADRREEDTA